MPVLKYEAGDVSKPTKSHLSHHVLPRRAEHTSRPVGLGSGLSNTWYRSWICACVSQP